ncbi:shikimate kinase [Candidatus Vidania fulgoroideorum]
MKNIYFLGFMGVGKTFISSKFEKYKSCYMYCDMDKISSYIYNKKISKLAKNTTIFRKLEKNIINFLKKDHNKEIIVSTGGGVILNKVNLLRINIYSISLCLLVNKNFLKKNISKKDRPILKNNNFKYIIESRKKIYKKSSLFFIKNSMKDFKKTMFKIFNML